MYFNVTIERWIVPKVTCCPERGSAVEVAEPESYDKSSSKNYIAMQTVTPETDSEDSSLGKFCNQMLEKINYLPVSLETESSFYILS